MSGILHGPADEVTRKSANGRSVNRSCIPCRTRKVKCDAGAVGLPCSNCVSRKCVEECGVVVRKRRTKVDREAQCTDLRSQNTSNICIPSPPSPNTPCQTPDHTGQDLLFLNILGDAVGSSATSGQNIPAAGDSSISDSGVPVASASSTYASFASLDEIDRQYLAKKGVFDLPTTTHLDTFIKNFFDHVYAFVPVLDKADFLRDHQTSNQSLFLLYVVLTLASLYVPQATLIACGLSSRSAAQELFFTKAILLHDIVYEVPLVLLQGSIMLCTVVLDHPTDRDLGYWLHNAVRLATKLDLRNTCIREDTPNKLLQQYRRICWSLYCLDNFHVFNNTSRSRLLVDVASIRLRTDYDVEVDGAASESSTLLSEDTSRHIIVPIETCELSRLAGDCLSAVKTGRPRDPCRILEGVDQWRGNLAARMHVIEEVGVNLHYRSILAMSYRFECILCRLMRRIWPKSCHENWSARVKQRLGSAILELDSIAARVSMSGTLHEFPISFITTLTTLLALHIEVALDTTETELARAMARNSISRLMIILNEGKDIPALERALPVFDDIITRKSLNFVPANSLEQNAAQLQVRSEHNEVADSIMNFDFDTGSAHFEACGLDCMFGTNFEEFRLMDEWHIDKLNPRRLD